MKERTSKCTKKTYIFQVVNIGQIFNLVWNLWFITWRRMEGTESPKPVVSFSLGM